MKPGHKNVHLGFELEPTTSNETLQPAKFQLSNSQPQNHPTGPPVGRLIPSTEMHCNQFPSTQTCSLRKKVGIAGKHSPPTGGIGGIDLPVGVVYICKYIYIYIGVIEKHSKIIGDDVYHLNSSRSLSSHTKC